jgi:hypothetical protein
MFLRYVFGVTWKVRQLATCKNGRVRCRLVGQWLLYLIDPFHLEIELICGALHLTHHLK